MGSRHRQPAVPHGLAHEISDALARVDAARGRLDQAVADRSGLGVRRAAHADLSRTYDEADELLREATRAAKDHSYREWSRWRRVLSRLDNARQRHLLTEADQPGLRPSGSVRAIDTGMSGPAIGDHQHGECSPAGKPATYGVDVEAVLLGTVRTTGPGGAEVRPVRPRRPRPSSAPGRAGHETAA